MATGRSACTTAPLLAVLLALLAASAHGLQSSPKRAAKRNPSEAHGKKYRQELTNFMDVQYTGTVHVGGQPIEGVLDTGSFEVLVFSANCETCGPELKYDGNKSKTRRLGKMITEHSFGSGNARSQEAWETVSLGPLVAEDQPYWEVLQAEMPVLSVGRIAGIIGVGPPNTVREHAKLEAEMTANHSQEAIDSGIPEATVRSAVKQAREKAKAMQTKATLLESLGLSEFSVCLLREKNASGYFIWNDDARFQPDARSAFHKIPVQAAFNWGTKMTGAILRYRGAGVKSPVEAPELNEGLLADRPLLRRVVDIVRPHPPAPAAGDSMIGCENGCGALFDSGTSLIGAPTSVVKEVMQMLKSFGNDCRRINEMPDLTFTIEGREYTLSPDMYVGQVVMDMVITRPGFTHGPLRFLLPPKPLAKLAVPACRPLLMAMDQDTQFGPMWILGMPFFRNYYTTFSHTRKGPPYEQALYIAPAGEDCTPGKAAALITTEDGHERHMEPRTVHVSQLRLPRWAYGEGYVPL